MTGRDDSGADRRLFVAGAYPEDQNPLLPKDFSLIAWAKKHRIRAFGWLDGGVSSVAGASGLMAEAPTPNRFSNQAMLDAAWLAWSVRRARVFPGDSGWISSLGPTLHYYAR